MNKATPLHQQHQDLNFFLYLSRFSKEHLSRLAAILRASNLLDLNSEVQKVLPPHFPFQNNAYIQKEKQLVSIWFVVHCQQSGLNSFGKLTQSLESISQVGRSLSFPSSQIMSHEKYHSLLSPGSFS